MIRYEISATVKSRKRADNVVSALELMGIKAHVTESGPLGELLDAEEERNREVTVPDDKS